MSMMTYETSVLEAERVTVQPKKIWMTAFILCFLILLADGVDLAFLAYSLTSIKAEFNLTTVQAGALGSWSLVGGVIGGLIGGWACDRFGPGESYCILYDSCFQLILYFGLCRILPSVFNYPQYCSYWTGFPIHRL
jgi:Permeases of the major facilitator superfamily